MDNKTLKRIADNIRVLSVAMPEKAKSGHPGGPMGGGNYFVTGGFWALINVVQTPGAPELNISHSGNVVTVFWVDVAGWNLQQNGNLAVTNGWSSSGGVTLTNGMNYLNLTNPAGNLYFRLKNP